MGRASLLFAILLASAAPALAADGPNQLDKPAVATPSLAGLRDAQELRLLALEHEDPYMMLAAVQLMAIYGDGAGDGPAPIDTAVAELTELAADQPALIERGLDLAAMRARGRTVGAGMARGVVPAEDEVAFFSAETEFVERQAAELVLRGSGRTDLDLFVFDELGNEICRSEGVTANEYCAWTPRWTGAFRIVIKNLGQAESGFELLTN
ncbi:MAG: hypothetical protein AAFX81_13820 [Pseudomonadota bacterium]